MVLVMSAAGVQSSFTVVFSRIRASAPAWSFRHLALMAAASMVITGGWSSRFNGTPTGLGLGAGFSVGLKFKTKQSVAMREHPACGYIGWLLPVWTLSHKSTALTVATLLSHFLEKLPIDRAMLLASIVQSSETVVACKMALSATA